MQKYNNNDYDLLKENQELKQRVKLLEEQLKN